MHKIIIADTSCIILFTNIEELDLLKALYSEIVITPEISDEYGKPLPEWIIVKDVSDKPKQDILALKKSCNSVFHQCPSVNLMGNTCTCSPW